MSYVTEANEFGKTAVQIVELHMSRCTRTYGVAPCVATIGITGSDRCFNTTATCQDRPNLNLTDYVYRFSSQRIDDIQQVGDPPTIPTLLSVKTAPTILTPGKGLGVRSSLSVQIQDHPWTDVDCDPYRTQRSYDPDSQGTYWGRWLKRNRFYENRRIDVLTGFINNDGSYDIANFKKRTYFISKISGPDANGIVTIEAKDALKLADGEKAKWPKASLAKLSVAVNELTTSFVIADPDLDVSYWWNSGQRYLRCEEEIVRATAIAGVNTTTPTLTVVRGSMPAWYDASQNVAMPHDIDASLQPCWLWQNAPVYDIVYFLLNTVAGIDSSYLPLAEWTAEITNGFSYLNFSALLIDPVSVKDLLVEITQLSVLIFWNEREQKVKMKGLRFTQLIGPQINDDVSIVADSVASTEDVAELNTEVWIYYDLSWPLANMQLLQSYRNVDIRVNLDRESAEEYQRKSIKQIKTRWLPRSQLGVAVEVGSTLLRQYQDVRKVITFTMDPKDDIYWVGDTVGISTFYVQDEYGRPDIRNYLITQAEEMVGDQGMLIKYVATELYSFVRTGLITHPSNPGGPVDPTPAPSDYSLASNSEKNTWAFICYNNPPSDPKFLDGTKAYQIV